MYHCTLSLNCLPLHQLCDGIRQCPKGDDEDFCDITCSRNCSCVGLSVSCVGAALVGLPDVHEHTRFLDVSGNDISDLDRALLKKSFLFSLVLSHNALRVLEAFQFQDLLNLQKLDLSDNLLRAISANAFYGLKHLDELLLRANPYLAIVDRFAFTGLVELPLLDLSHLNLQFLAENVFAGLDNLLELNVSYNRIGQIQSGAFNGLERLQKLDISGNPVSDIDQSTFSELESMLYLESSNFKFCCLASQVPRDQCNPPPDEISSCQDLMARNYLRGFLWILGTMACAGNAFVVLWRLSQSQAFPSDIIITNLGISDLFMGIYMISIGSADIHYRGNYIENIDRWKNSLFCKLLGFLATLSSEGSMMFLCLLTIDRFINIVFPFGGMKLNAKSTRVTVSVIWGIAGLMAGLPLLIKGYFGENFYGRSGVCLALPITTEKPDGWEYSTAIYIGFNSVLIAIITLAYGYIYKIVHQSGKATGNMERKRQMALARKLMIIVFTDMGCWLPIIIMGKS